MCYESKPLAPNMSSSCEEVSSEIPCSETYPLKMELISEKNNIKENICIARLGDQVRKNAKVFKFRRKMSTLNDVIVSCLIFAVVLCFLPSHVVSSEDRESDTKLQNSFHNDKVSNRTADTSPWHWQEAEDDEDDVSSTTTTSTTVAPSKVCRPSCSNGICDTSTGTCVCNPGWRGDQCDLCGGKVK